MTYVGVQRIQKLTKNNKLFNEPSSQQPIQIFVRNYAKNAIKLLMRKKINTKVLFEKISSKMNIRIEDLYLFLHGKLVENKQQQIELHNGLIFHMVNLKRVNLHQIRIFFRRIQQNSNIHNLVVDPNLLIKDFMKNILRQKYPDIQNYFLVYTGRQLQQNNSFRQQYVEDQSQILVVHKIQNLKSKNTQVKKIQKIGNTYENQPLVTNTQNFTTKLTRLENNNAIDKFSIQKDRINTRHDNGKEEQHGESSQKLTTFMINKSEKKVDQQNSYEQQGSMPHQLYETAKFNSPEELLQFSKNISRNKNNSNGVILQQQQMPNSEQEQQQILIGNYDAYSYSAKGVQKNDKENQQSKEEVKKQGKQSIKNQISTRYGLVPKQKSSDINRYAEEQKNIQQLDDRIIILGEKQLGNQDIGSINQAQIQDYNEMERRIFEEQLHKKGNEDMKGSKIGQSHSGDIRNQSQTRISYGNNPALLATISSRYDEQQLYGMDSLLRSVQNRSLSPNTVFYNGEGSIINIINSSGNSDKKSRKLSNSGSGDNPLIKNIYLTDSVELEETRENKLQKQQKDIINQQQCEQEEIAKQRIKISQIHKDASDPKQQNWNQGRATEEIGMKKRHNRVQVKDMIQTVSPNFYKPQEEADTPPKLEQKEVHRSEIRSKKKKNIQNNSEGMKQQQDNTDEQDLQSVTFVYDPTNQGMGKVQKKQAKQQVKDKKKWTAIKRTDSQDIFGGDDLLNPGNIEIKDKNSSEGKDSNGSAVQLYMPLIDLPMIQPIKLPSPVKFSREEFNQQREKKKIEQAALKDQILRNVSNVSSVYHQASQSSNPTSRHDVELHQAILPKYANQMRDSFTSNVLTSEGRGKLWEDQSNRLSIGSIESQTLYMTELPESSGQLGQYYLQAQQNIQNLQIQKAVDQKGPNSPNSSSENMSNILGSEADIKHHDEIVQNGQGEVVESTLRSSSTSNMRKKNKVQEIQNISSIVARDAKPRTARTSQTKYQKQEECQKQQTNETSNKVESPDVLVHFGVEKNNIYEVLGSVNEVNKSAQQSPTQRQNQGDLCYSKHTEIVEDSNSCNFNVMQDSNNSNNHDSITQTEVMNRKVINLDNLSQIKNQQVDQWFERKNQTTEKQQKDDSLLLESSSHLPKNSQKSIENIFYGDEGDQVLRSMQGVEQKSQPSKNIQSSIKNKFQSEENLLDNYLGHGNNSSSSIARDEAQQNDLHRKVEDLHQRVMIDNEKTYNSFSLSFSLGQQTKIDDKDMGINIGDMIMMENTNALYNTAKKYNHNYSHTINFAQQLRNQFTKQFEQLSAGLIKNAPVASNFIAQQTKNEQKNTQNEDENLLLQYL